MANAPIRSRGHHLITVCTVCRPDGQARAPGAELIRRLRQGIAPAGAGGRTQVFAVTDVACMAGCSRPCTLAFQAEGKATYLFGDIDPSEDIDALLAFARQYARSADGWTRSAERPPGLAGKTLARIPAMIGAERARAEG